MSTCVAALGIVQVNVLEWNANHTRLTWGKKTPYYVVRVFSVDFDPHMHVRIHKQSCACDSAQVDV